MNKESLFFLFILTASFSTLTWAEPTPTAETDSKTPPNATLPKAGEKTLPIILVRTFPYIPSWRDYDCGKDGLYMALLAVNENGTWNNQPKREFLLSPNENRPLVEMNNPDHHHIPSKEIPLSLGGSSRGFTFKDASCYSDNDNTDPHEILGAMVSMPAWCSRMRPAQNPPLVEELSARMKRELQALENEGRDACKKDPNCCGYTGCCDICGKEGYDPDRLLPPEMTEALEFEIAPGECVLFITLRRRYPCIENGQHETPYTKRMRNLCFSSNWHTIVRKEGLEQLWSLGWAYWHDKADKDSCVMGAADVDGDGVSEVVIRSNGFEDESFDLYQYRDKKLNKLLHGVYGY